ncbi:MAG: phospholipase D family protein [Gammaproteobacteria bacterium]|nr:phospholipase D family protein [Gammaproteobacteria bacterium]MBT8093569.1 phospholipase D family protein [Gammaproteobacteria bacterium]NNF49358.1 phospholipase D family protein [Woeseiaceae bacterium]NNL62604.1 phospholipase D family protein [Woeseiaceae bacterium]
MFSTLVGSRLPPRYQRFFKLPERVESYKVTDTASTALGRSVRAWFAGRDATAAVYRLDSGIDALSARVGLIDRAERTIDMQSFLLKDDVSGNLVALHLAKAADRGVRVRLLMDDALTELVDPGLLSLDEHENIEVRVFNPFPRRRSRFISLLANYNILNRRMHNKSLTVDNEATIVGGRNIADEYYQTGGESEFIDEDLLAIGSPVDVVSDGFDEYWNSPEAIPMGAFDNLVAHGGVVESVAEARKLIDAHRGGPFLDGVDGRLVDRLVAGTLQLVPAEVEVVLDRPDKVRYFKLSRTSVTSDYLQRLATAAVRELIVISPYFVPRKEGVDFFAALVKRGVNVIIITNSLASTNHASVHAVYARYRKPLLQHGVQLFELRARSESAEARTKLTLHSKVATVDRQRLFVGSFNLDPRSLYLNTEMGMMVESSELAESMATSILVSLPESSYRLRLSERGKLQWVLQTTDVEEVITTEPQSGAWLRFRTWLLGLLPIEEQM